MKRASRDLAFVLLGTILLFCVQRMTANESVAKHHVVGGELRQEFDCALVIRKITNSLKYDTAIATASVRPWRHPRAHFDDSAKVEKFDSLTKEFWPKFYDSLRAHLDGLPDDELKMLVVPNWRATVEERAAANRFWSWFRDAASTALAEVYDPELHDVHEWGPRIRTTLSDSGAK